MDENSASKAQMGSSANDGGAAEVLPFEKKLEGLLDAMGTQAPHRVLGLLSGQDFVRAERALYQRCAYVQECTLDSIVRYAAGSEFGRAHRFDEIRSIEDFRRLVPLSDYDDYAKSIERMTEGEADVLFPGKASFFYETSGSTGAGKYVPESPMEAEARKVLTKTRRVEMGLAAGVRRAGRVFGFFNRSCGALTAGGIPAGTASGKTAQAAGGSVLFAYSPLVVEELEGEALYYTIMRISMVHPDVSAILGNNAHVLTTFVELAMASGRDIIDDIRHGTNRYPLSDELKNREAEALAPNPARADELEGLLEAGRLIPRYYWPELKVASFWLGGSVGVYVDETRRLLPEGTTYIDVGYGASEAKINIPLRPETPAGPLSITTSFFEFIPESGKDSLLAHELEDGKTYELVLTTYGGLYRYRLKDYVRVEGFTGTTPNIYFVSKSVDVANLVQEKIPGLVLLGAMRDFAEQAGLGFAGCQVFADASSFRYVFCVETRREPDDADDFAAGFEEHLLKTLPDYSYYRIDVPQLKPCKVRLMSEGWWDRVVDRCRKGNSTAAQVKVPVVVERMPRD